MRVRKRILSCGGWLFVSWGFGNAGVGLLEGRRVAMIG